MGSNQMESVLRRRCMYFQTPTGASRAAMWLRRPLGAVLIFWWLEQAARFSEISWNWGDIQGYMIYM